MQTVCEAAGGEEGLRRLARAWYARVMADEVVSHAFSDGFHPDHTERLSAYWTEAQVLHDYFAWATTTTMARYHDSADDVPAGLEIPKWSWGGLTKRTDPDGS